MTPLTTLVRQYRNALRDEPKLRGYAVASFVDDLGSAVSTWAAMLLMTNLFTTQRARASLMLPSLACFLVGTFVSGPIADWAARFSLAKLARWRWRVVVWARLGETAMLGVLMLALLSGPPTVARVLPFTMVSAFAKTAFRATRIAFSVDLLRHETVQVDANGSALLDERGKPLTYKTHLLVLTSLIATLAAGATLGGLLLGGRILDLTAGRYWPLFLVEGVMHLGFVAVVFLFCHPERPAREASFRELFGDLQTEEASCAGGGRCDAALFWFLRPGARGGIQAGGLRTQRGLRPHTSRSAPSRRAVRARDHRGARSSARTRRRGERAHARSGVYDVR